MKKALSIIAGVLALVACQKQSETIPVYAWYNWHPETVSTDSLKTIFENFASHGMVGICCEFHFGPESMEKIQTCGEIAHEVGLEYHVWIPSVLQHNLPAEWYTVNRLGQSAAVPEDRAYVTYYETVDPHNPEVVNYLVENYAAIAEIDVVDYVQLDYIRYADVILAEGLWEKYDGVIDHQWRDAEGNVQEYPGADYCYCDDCVADFKAKTGIDIREVENPSECAEWAQFRCDNVTNLVNAIADAVHAKGKKVSADVFPGPASYAEKMVRQQWGKWNIDMFFPMNYNDFYLEPAAWVKTVTEEEVNSTDKPVISGLFICHDWQKKASLVDPEYSGLIPSEMEEAVKGAMAAGAAGVCLFTPDRMTEEHWAAFDAALGL